MQLLPRSVQWSVVRRSLQLLRVASASSAVVVLSFALTAPSAHADISVYQPARWALIIGIDRYAEPQLPKLLFAESDARRFRDQLTHPDSGVVPAANAVTLLGLQATRAKIVDTLARLRGQLRRGDHLFVYFAGLSFRDPDLQELFLVPHDVALAESRPQNALALAGEVIPRGATPDTHLTLVLDCDDVGDGLLSHVVARYPAVSVLSASKQGEGAGETIEVGGGLLTKYLVESMNSPHADLDGDRAISLEESYHYLYPRVVKHGAGRQHPSVAGYVIHKVPLAWVPQDSLTVVSDDDLPADLLHAAGLVINGQSVRVTARPTNARTVTFLGRFPGLIAQGLNAIASAKERYQFWHEEQKLWYYREPYKSSFAVLIAVDDYERKHDPQRRGSTGYPERLYMVQHAQKLREILRELGFPDRNIITLYDADATSEAVDKTLKSFWKGGANEHADRLFIYFGGHGDALGNVGYLVTYDHHPSRPTLTSVLMRDLTGRHAENIAAHHVMVAIDACHSGLAVYRKLGPETALDERRLRQFQTFSAIRNDTYPRARNLLVAGTEDQGALWDNGGIFTKALIEGLGGKADWNGDGIIQFDEIATYVRNAVAARASQANVRQESKHYRLDALGTGSLLFLTPRRQFQSVAPWSPAPVDR